MNWRMKGMYFFAGFSVNMAMLLALAGNSLCFAFALLAAIYWQIGNRIIEAGDKKEGE